MLVQGFSNLWWKMFLSLSSFWWNILRQSLIFAHLQTNLHLKETSFLNQRWHCSGKNWAQVFYVHPEIFFAILNFYCEHILLYWGKKKLFSSLVKCSLLKIFHIHRLKLQILTVCIVAINNETAPDTGGRLIRKFSSRKYSCILQKPEYHLCQYKWHFSE